MVGQSAFSNDKNKLKTAVTQDTSQGAATKLEKQDGRHNNWLTDKWQPNEGAEVKLRTMTYQNYDPRHPAVLVNQDLVFV